MENRSIHPRNWTDTPKSKRVKSNTRRGRSAETTAKLIRALSAHCERHPKDGQSVARLAKIGGAQ